MYPLKGLLIYPLPVVHYSFAPRAASFSLCMHGWHQCTKLMEHTADCVTVDIYSMKQCLLSRAARLSRLSWMTDNTGLCRTSVPYQFVPYQFVPFLAARDQMVSAVSATLPLPLVPH